MTISTASLRTRFSIWFGTWKSPSSLVALTLLLGAGVFGGDYLTREDEPAVSTRLPGMPRAVTIEIAAPAKVAWPSLPGSTSADPATRTGLRSVIYTTQEGRAVIRVQSHQGGDVVTFDAETGRVLDTRSPASLPMSMDPDTTES